MTELATRPPARLSPTTRLVTTALAAARACDCDSDRRRVCVLRGFDRRSRQQANRIRSRLTRLSGVRAHDAAVPVMALDPTANHRGHVCAFIDASDRSTEAERIAALTHTPLVTLNGSADHPGPQHIPTLRARFDTGSGEASPRPFPSAVGRVPDVAFETFLVVPNQPETGDLSVSIGDQHPRDLVHGTSVKLRCLPEAMLVEAIDPHGDATSWLTSTAEIQQHSGLHTIYRDGLCITDLDQALAIHHDPTGLHRHHA